MNPSCADSDHLDRQKGHDMTRELRQVRHATEVQRMPTRKRKVAITVVIRICPLCPGTSLCPTEMQASSAHQRKEVRLPEPCLQEGIVSLGSEQCAAACNKKTQVCYKALASDGILLRVCACVVASAGGHRDWRACRANRWVSSLAFRERAPASSSTCSRLA